MVYLTNPNFSKITIIKTTKSKDLKMSLQEVEINDDIPTLSAEALKALNEFLAERESQEKIIDENWVKILIFLSKVFIVKSLRI